MADRPGMTAAQLANKLLVDEHPDVLRESAAWMAAELMEAEVAAQVGAELGERTSERVTHRNGYRPRTWPRSLTHPTTTGNLSCANTAAGQITS
jgi:transposase-like protein